ncbi:MAG: acireductone synthase [Sphingobacteriales bacterium]|nr:MAG: acireductone synthase [Sphingobacteriales bacterium]
MIRFILTDIEGTTTSIHFVHKVLFPYAKEHLREFVEVHNADAEVKACIDETTQTIFDETHIWADQEKCIAILEKWIDDDRKHLALKTLQGHIWREGYETGKFTGHIYEDVPDILKEWKNAGLDLGVYSSGSVEAQQLLFRHSDFGDLTSYFTAFFDTQVGQKRESDSYKYITSQLPFLADEILFLSDIEEELDAAKIAGMQTIQLVRDHANPSSRHETAVNFVSVNEQIAELNKA